MRRTSFSDMNCSIARSLEQIGEWWTLLIIREAFFGTRRFGAFQANLGIAPNVLTQRLQDLVAHGILEVKASSENGRALDYRLTDKGRDLFPIIVALTQWGDRHAAPPEGPPVRIVERRSGKTIAPITLRSSSSGRALGLHEVTVAPGPGATPQQLAYFERVAQRQAEKAAAREAGPQTPDQQDRADRKG